MLTTTVEGTNNNSLYIERERILLVRLMPAFLTFPLLLLILSTEFFGLLLLFFSYYYFIVVETTEIMLRIWRVFVYDRSYLHIYSQWAGALESFHLLLLLFYDFLSRFSLLIYVQCLLFVSVSLFLLLVRSPSFSFLHRT